MDNIFLPYEHGWDIKTGLLSKAKYRTSSLHRASVIQTQVQMSFMGSNIELLTLKLIKSMKG